MRLAKKLGDRIMFLHEARAIFFGTVPEMERCEDDVVRQFLELDELIVPGLDGPGSSIHA
jgi:phospholipid/cholesterol/gamma-HCH transport system ATP-binding protein